MVVWMKSPWCGGLANKEEEEEEGERNETGTETRRSQKRANAGLQLADHLKVG